jgi:pimeloyl-ACP methyl ester carboxylesterase
VKAEFEELMVQLGGTFGTMLVRLWRPDNPRGSVFCIHGFEGNGGDFDYLANHLVQYGFMTVCPDMIGRGKSSFFRDASKYNVNAYLICLAALSKYAGKKNYFLGTSWGGVLAMAFLAGAGIKAEKLVLNDVSLRGSPAADRLTALIRQEASFEFNRIEEAYAYVRRTRAFLGKIPEALWPDYLQNRVRLENGKYRLAYDPMTVPAARVEIYDRIPLLEKINAEVLLLYGEHSQLFDAEAVAKAISSRTGVSCISVPGAAHPLSLMTREQALLVSDFLTS